MLAAGLLIVGVCGPPAIAACRPAASVQGPAEIVSPIVAILVGHGVGTAPSSCGARVVQASLEAHSGTEGYKLHVLDAEGHSSDRQVADASTAASLIETWTLAEDADLWVPRPAPGATEGAIPPAPEAVAARSAEGSDALSQRARVRFGAQAEMSLSPDSALWWGAGASVCARVRAFCVGGRASVARAETTLEIRPALGIAPDLTRTLSGLSAFAAWTVSAGRFWVAPSLGLGAAWLYSKAAQAGVTSTTNDVLGLGAAGAVTGLTIGRGWSVALGLGGTAALALHGDSRAGTTTYVPTAPHAFFTAGAGVWYAP
jgi:hypothetical protein